MLIQNRYNSKIITTIEETRGADLRGADLRGADLRGADLRGADLRGADFRGADFYEANLSGADLDYADLRGADLRGADLYGANLYGANLYGADLYGANLYGAILTSYYTVNLSDKQLVTVDTMLVTNCFESERVFWLDMFFDAPDDLLSAIKLKCFGTIRKAAIQHREYIESKVKSPKLRRLLELVYFRDEADPLEDAKADG